MSVDSLGNPLRFILTGGQQHDITQAEGLIDGYEGEYVLADKGYDSQGFRQHILERGMTPVIPPLGSPAHAGIDPNAITPPGRNLWFPRTRGDRPTSSTSLTGVRQVPPHTRG